jgi:hypothetical protein
MPANQLRVNELLNLLAGRAGLGHLKLNDLGICTFQFGGGMHFVVELPLGTTVVYLMAPLARIPADKDEAHALYRRALKANYRGEETAGSSLTLHEALNHIVLWRASPVSALNGPAFIQMVEQFLGTAIRLAPVLDQAGGEPADVKQSVLQNAATLPSELVDKETEAVAAASRVALSDLADKPDSSDPHDSDDASENSATVSRHYMA